jgi:hypothetical protein
MEQEVEENVEVIGEKGNERNSLDLAFLGEYEDVVVPSTE